MTQIMVINVRKLRTKIERMTCVYVGRKWAGFESSPWHNPFRVGGKSPQSCKDVAHCLKRFTEYLASWNHNYRERMLQQLWEETEQGTKPLGCWCTVAIHGDGSPVVCHAQIIAAMLHERFIEDQGT